MDQADHYANMGVTGENAVACKLCDSYDGEHYCIECEDEITAEKCKETDGLCDRCYAREVA